MSFIATRMEKIQPFHVMALLARARELEAQGKSIVHMEIGEPDFPSPEAVIKAGQQALANGKTHYTPARGLAELRLALSRYYKKRYDADISPERFVVTPGSSGALQLVMSVLLNPGDQMLLADPGYPCNRNFVYLVGGEPRLIPVEAEQDFQPTLADVKEYWTDRARGLLLASPANPTGTVISRAQLLPLADWIRERQGFLIMDEIYHGLEYGESRLGTAADLDAVFVVNSFSKYFGMTGWRLGWLIAPEEFIPALDKLAQNIFLAASTPAQYAALACFDDENLWVLERRRAEFQTRRDYLVPALEELGFVVRAKPQGAFYVYADCSRHSQDSFGFCQALLEQAGVAITPGIDFGEHQASRHVRFAYTTSLDNLREGVNRIKNFIST